MTSPLAQFANARILYTAPGARSSGRDGFKVAEGQAYLIQAFLKRRDLPALLDDRMRLPAVNGMPIEFEGYVISYALLTPLQADDFDTIDLATLSFDTSAHLPPEVRRDARAKLHIPGMDPMDVRFTDKAGKFGTEGIGGIIRGVLGDPLFLEGGAL